VCGPQRYRFEAPTLAIHVSLAVVILVSCKSEDMVVTFERSFPFSLKSSQNNKNNDLEQLAR
jgi:hypothetical protein